MSESKICEPIQTKGKEDKRKDIESSSLDNVISMRVMFKGCESFNQPLNNWDISQETDIISGDTKCEVAIFDALLEYQKKKQRLKLKLRKKRGPRTKADAEGKANVEIKDSVVTDNDDNDTSNIEFDFDSD